MSAALGTPAGMDMMLADVSSVTHPIPLSSSVNGACNVHIDNLSRVTKFL